MILKTNSVSRVKCWSRSNMWTATHSGHWAGRPIRVRSGCWFFGRYLPVSCLGQNMVSKSWNDSIWLSTSWSKGI